MAERRESMHGQWSGRWVYVLAAAGSAVGLGNIWKFPYITGENGGGAFVLVYLVCIAIIGIPVMMGEVLIGRRGRRNPAESMAVLASEAGAAQVWRVAGWFAVLASFLILTFYVVIAGWSVAYIFITAAGTFTDAPADTVGETFGAFVGSWPRLLVWSSLVTVLTILVVGRGVQAGLERAVRYLMPGLFVLLLVLVGYSMNEADFREGFSFLFSPDFSKITPGGVLVALGHAFFTLSLASGVMMAYGSYLPADVSIFRSTLLIGVLDTVVALLAGLAIFPLVFAYDLEPGEGPGLIFQTLPIAFGQMPGGTLFGTLFFIMLSFAAFTSAISLLEPTVAMVMERTGLPRMATALAAGGIMWTISLGTVFSFNLWSDKLLFRQNFFDNLDDLTANFMLPLGGLFVAVFCAWIMREESTRDELGLDDSRVYTFWRFDMRYIAPVAILAVFLHAIGFWDWLKG